MAFRLAYLRLSSFFTSKLLVLTTWHDLLSRFIREFFWIMAVFVSVFLALSASLINDMSHLFSLG